MNRIDALSAYGAAKTQDTSGTAKGAVRTPERTETEPFLYTEQQIENNQTSELYSKTRKAEEEGAADEKETTEAEKNQERLDNLSGRMTQEDMQALADEGFPIGEMTAEQLEAAMERIKLQKELAAGAQEHQAEQLQDAREAVLKQAVALLPGNPKAELIAEKLWKANLPITQANLEKIAAAMERAEGGIRVRPEEAEYLVRNKLTPTLENLSMAKQAAGAYRKKERELSPDAWKQLEPTVTHLLFQAGLRANSDMIGAAQAFIKKDIPLTVDNLRAYSQLINIRLTEEEVLTKAVDAAAIGQEPKSMNLLSSTAKEVRQIIKRTGEVTEQAVHAAAGKESRANPSAEGAALELSLGALAEAQDAIDRGEPVVQDYLKEYADSGAAQAASIKARRQLEEIKAKMTFEAGYRLAKEGIRIDTVSMNRLIDSLRALENRFYSGFFTQAGIGVGRYTQADVDLLRDTTQKLNEIKEMPAALVVETMDVGSRITPEELHQAGSQLMTSFRRFQETYETVMTAPKPEMGDRITRAFEQADSLLRELGAEPTEQNRRAVRMLGYSQTEITAENLERVTAYDEKLQQVLKELHPAVTVRMIRDGINPLRESLDSLSEKIGEIKAQEGIQEEDNFSSFLVNLDRKNGITEEERKAYIAIYRALHQVESAEEEAVGAVFKNGQELTLGNLLTAVRSGRAKGMDHTIDQAFGGLANLERDTDRIEAQIRMGLQKPDSPEGRMLNNLAEQTDNTMKELMTQTDAPEQLARVQTLASEGANATRFLEDFNILTTMENLQAAKELLAGDMTIFKDWKRFKSMATGEEVKLPDFTESLKDRETMQAAYQEFLNETKNVKTVMQHDPVMTRYDVKAIKKMDVGVRFMNRLCKREFYQIPVDTGADIVQMNVTILSKGEENARVRVEIPTEHLGKVSAEATVQEGRLKCFVSSDTREGTQALKERRLNLFAVLAENQVEIGSIFYGTEEVTNDSYTYRTDGIYKESQGSEDTEGADNRTMYRIAKSLVAHVRNADADFQQ